MAGFFSDIANDVTYKNLPEKIDEEELEGRVIRLRSGDTSEINPICLQLMRLSLSLINKFSHKHRLPDLIGVTLLELVETVKMAEKNLNDNNIIPYVITSINRRLKDFITDDHTVRVPSRTLRLLRSQGIEVQLFSHRMCSADAPNNLNEDNRYYNPAVAKPEQPSTECLELLSKIVRNDREKILLDMKGQGYTLQEIANSLGVSVGLVHYLKTELKERYEELERD